MRLFFSTILTLFVSVTSFAVTTINVHVTDKDGNPVPNAKVEVKGVNAWEEEDFLETIGEDFHKCFEEKGYVFDTLEDFFLVPLSPDFESVKSDEVAEVTVKKEVLNKLETCGYFEDLDTWEEQMRKYEGRFKSEYITTVRTDASGYARVEVDGYEEYRVAVSNSVRFFKDGAENVKMSVVTEADVVRMIFGEFFERCVLIDGSDWTLYVVKSNPYFDIRKSFPYNDSLLRPEDILKYYPEIHDIRVLSKDAYSEHFLNRWAWTSWGTIPAKDRSFSLYLEQGEYQFILSSDDGSIVVDDVDTRTVRSNYSAKTDWRKDSAGRWLLYFFVDMNYDYKTKTPPDNIQIPTVITPYTQDGLNDDFLPGYEVEIFDYYGNFVSSSANGWDGRKGSDLAPPGIYFYKVKLKDGRKRKGTVEVIKM